MPINNRELMQLAAEISRIDGLKVSIKESMKGGLFAGLTTTIGGVLLGPIGLAVGGVLGGITAAVISNGKFRSVVDIILNDLTPGQQALLINRINNIVKDLRIEDAALLLPFVLGNQALHTAILGIVSEFVTNDLSYQLA